MISAIESAHERELAELRLQVNQLTHRNASLVRDNMARQNERAEFVEQIYTLKRLLNQAYGATTLTKELE